MDIITLTNESLELTLICLYSFYESVYWLLCFLIAFFSSSLQVKVCVVPYYQGHPRVCKWEGITWKVTMKVS